MRQGRRERFMIGWRPKKTCVFLNIMRQFTGQLHYFQIKKSATATEVYK